MNLSSSRRRSRAAAVTLLAAVAIGTCGAIPASAAAGFTFSEQARIGGAGRVDTAVKASQTLYPNGGSDDVVLVNSTAVVDGLSASYLAGLHNAPILFSGSDALPSATAAEIKRLKAKNVWLVGGTGVLSTNLESTLKGDYTVKRYAGDDRYGTAAAVATAGEFQPERVFVTSGLSLADAVTVGPVSWAANYPILLTKAGSVPKATSDALKTLGTAHVTVVGGTGVVSDPTAKSLGATDRLGGANRQATAVAVADNAVTTANFTHANAALVGGDDANSVDALAAAAVAGSTGTPLLYVKSLHQVGDVTAAYLKANRTELTADSVALILGGTGAVDKDAAAQASAAAQ